MTARREPRPEDQGARFSLETHVRRHAAWAKKSGVGHEPTPRRKADRFAAAAKSGNRGR